ncbi:TPA: alpha/beta hydrolase fold domain-containing protein [Burkholderia cepacia]|uniref:alpha/beta hydrolase fold domain-containing protein n=1 Tax=Burkholderia cepacia TaxID=292 RepID=UPI0015E44786|nr:alpha/beta hydrolase fold domain-containing protein [Burkholderia cepacia]HDR9512066.1 alpha/beta hydrolase fold domain-containing protein [Burkholderia cepacia]
MREADWKDLLEREVLNLVAGILKIPGENLDPHEDLINYGADSIFVTAIMARISELCGASIAPTVFFEARNVADLSKILSARYKKSIKERYHQGFLVNSTDYLSRASAGAAFDATPSSKGNAEIWLARHRIISTRAPIKPPSILTEAMPMKFNEEIIKVDPQVKRCLEIIKRISSEHSWVGRDCSYSEQIARERRQSHAVAALSGKPESIFKIENMEISSDDGVIPIRLYRPCATTGLPVFIFYHGGGFNTGDLDTHDTLLRALANRSLCLVVSVGYRLAPEHPYPAATDDAWAALEWVVHHALDIGADPLRLTVGGDSAGGTLAAWVSQKAASSGVILLLQVLLYPFLDATISSKSWREFGNGDFIVNRDHMIELLSYYTPPNVNRTDPSVSPYYAKNLFGVAPALVVTAEYDPLRDEGEAYAAKLKAENVAVDLIRYPGMVHGFASLAGVIDAGRAVIEQIGNIIRNVVQKN